jgi:hypothetical protein
MLKQTALEVVLELAEAADCAQFEEIPAVQFVHDCSKEG